jgi:hypothetical protein
MNITRVITRIIGWNRSLLASLQNITMVVTQIDGWNKFLYNSRGVSLLASTQTSPG